MGRSTDELSEQYALRYEDRRRRAEALMRELEPGFVPTHRPHVH